MTEAIELLIDAGQWRAADDLYRSACNDGQVWLHLPAARLGQRTATAFVATPARRDACATCLPPSRLGHYLNETGLHAMDAGDLTTARDYLTLGARRDRDAVARPNLEHGLPNLAGCLGLLGLADPAWKVATEALASSTSTHDRNGVRFSHVHLGWLAGLAGDTATAEKHFTAADRIRFTDLRVHLYSFSGVLWARWLGRTGRPGPARDLTLRNVSICRDQGLNNDLARCDQILGALALATGDAGAAERSLTAAVTAFRDADYLTELAEALPSLAACAQALGDLDTAERHLAEAVTIAGPRDLIPALAAALAARARLRAAQAISGNTDALAQGRDDADAALRLAFRHHLPWQELDALTGHAALDEAEGINHGWAVQADRLRAELVPPGLDPDPLATVERLVQAGQAASV